MIRTTLKTILAILAASAALTFSACSDIDEADRYIPVESVAPERCVLVEDFTGQNCINCPAAHETLERLVEQYGDNVIPVSIHCGGFGISVDYTRYKGLMQPEGNTYNDAWGIDSWPKGVVDRTGGAINHEQWPSAVRDELKRPTPLSIDLKAVCPEGDDKVSIEVTLSSTTDLSGSLQLWVLEDSIIARQQDINLGRIDDYVHNHVYRAAVNGVGGESVDMKAMIHWTKEYAIGLRTAKFETWVPRNLSIVAFLYDRSGVIQAARVRVDTSSDTDCETTNGN
ncbi:MAG: Omp28 family outer membrane lipoprotein [Clostridium sp.]|nr:Omp28 family outer membrane lipoprotein [Clostridium sp.]